MGCLQAFGPEPALLDAVEQLGLQCTAGDVATRTGFSLSVAEDELNALMVHTNASFTILGDPGTEQGERVVYSFPADFRSRVRRLRRTAALLDAWDKVTPVLFFALRFTLGVFIFVSLTIIALVLATLAVAALAALASGSGDGTARNARQLEFGGWNIHRLQGKLQRFVALWNQLMCIYMCFGGNNPFFIPPFWDPFFYAYAYGFGGYGGPLQHGQRAWSRPWRPRTEPASPSPSVVGASSTPARMVDGRIVREPRSRGPPQEQGAGHATDGLNVIEAIFSFLFGDGPPQPSSLERWRIVAAVIRQNRGVVCAETLAPYLEEPPAQALGCSTSDRQNDFNSAINPVVEHFRGQPKHVPGHGLLVYTFPELLGDAAANQLGLGTRADSCKEGRLPQSLIEGDWVFSRRNPWELQAAAALGFANLVGVTWLCFASAPHGCIARYLGSKVAVVLAAFAKRMLLPYAILFILVPLLRAAGYKLANRRAHARNVAREGYATAFSTELQEPGSAIREKERFAAALRKTLHLLPSAPAPGACV